MPTKADIDIDELVALHTEQGLSATQCARKMGFAPATAIKYLRREGVYSDGRGGEQK